MQVNEAVVCVDDRHFLCDGLLEQRPALGAYYTIRGFVDAQDEHGATKSVLLYELVNPLNERGEEHGFKLKRFNKV